jgi:acetyltransferase-like isoleucine patch superfamily enzyme
MRKPIWRYFSNMKNKLIFGYYGRDVYIFQGVRILRPQFISIGNHVRIGKHADIFARPGYSRSKEYLLKICNNVHIGSYNIIGARRSVVLEENALLGPRVIILDHTHQYEDVEVPIKDQDVTEGPIRIERDCWIGANVFVLPNVTIGQHAVVGANSVVNRDIPPYTLAAGVPARVIKRYDFDLKKWVRVDG